MWINIKIFLKIYLKANNNALWNLKYVEIKYATVAQ